MNIAALNLHFYMKIHFIKYYKKIIFVQGLGIVHLKQCGLVTKVGKQPKTFKDFFKSIHFDDGD